MTIRKVIDWAIEDQKSEMKGKIASPFYQQLDISGNWVWACDIELGGGGPFSVLRSVPIASNNLDVIYAEQGKGVSLSRMGSAKWSISGLSKTITDTVHTMYLTFSDETYEITGDLMEGDVIRPLSYGELGTLLSDPPGYGILPYGAQGKFDYYGTFLEVMEY